MQFLWIVAAWGGIGAFVDFYIGKAGQRRVRDWLETWWLKLSDVRWGDLGREEALFAVQVMDRLFGNRLFSAQRMIVVVVATFVCGGFIVALIMLSHITPFQWRAFFTSGNLIWLIIILFFFAASFSITRVAATVVARPLTKTPYLSLFGLIFLFLFQYVLVRYWAPLTNAIRLSIDFAYEGTTPWSFWTFIDISWYNIKFLIVKFIPLLFASAGITYPIFDVFTAGKDDGRPFIFMTHLTVLINLLPTLTRFSIMAIFIASFFLRRLQHPIMTLWARIIESDKPVFTLLFGGGAAIVKALHEIIS